MPSANKDQLEGITLRVYLYISKKSSPVGPREATRGAHLSSPSVAYRHLEKLEDMKLLQKNEYGEYTVKHKANIGGFIWIGRRVIPKTLAYSTIFFIILVIEFIALGVHYNVETFEFKIFFLLLIIVTGFALSVFVFEAIVQQRRFRRIIQSE